MLLDFLLLKVRVFQIVYKDRRVFIIPPINIPIAKPNGGINKAWFVVLKVLMVIIQDRIESIPLIIIKNEKNIPIKPNIKIRGAL
jgi:hypothetical protein